MALDVPVDEQDVREVELLVRSHYPFLFFAEPEPERVRALLERVALGVDVPLLTWKAHRGLVRVGGDGNAVYKTEPPVACLAHLVAANGETLTYLQDFERHLEDGEVQARLLELHDALINHKGAVVLSGNVEDLPPKLARYFTVIRLRTPSIEAYYRYVSDVLADVRKRQPVAVHLTSEDVAEMLEHLRGLPFHEIRKLVTQALVEDGRLDRDDLLSILEAKKRVVERVGLLEYIAIDEGSSVVGLSRLKRWLEKRRLVFTEPAKARKAGLPAPRGILLTGIQGCGKSLSAKALSASFRLPLVRLDPGSLYRKYFGESEQNLRRALETAESIAPCILWIDEIEKAFGGGSGDADGGTSRRIFGTFLTWMQEKKESVFVFATANDISQLPPELLRKGRFDEIFFVDLPEHEVREHIFAFHLARRQKDPAAFRLTELADKTLGFSGAEIEQAIVSGLYTAVAANVPLSTEILLGELEETQPLSVTMRERIAALRAWAVDRAVPVD